MNPGYRNGAGGQVEKSMGRGKRGGEGTSELVRVDIWSPLDRVGAQTISMELRGHPQV